MYPNTKKELFLGKRTFEAQNLAPDELISKMSECIKNNVNLSEYEYEEADFETCDINSRIETIVLILHSVLESADEEDNSLPDFTKVLLKDLNIEGSRMEDIACENEAKIVTLSNGFSYLRVLSKVYESFAYVYVALYMGSDGMIHGFIPMYGNNVFIGTNFQLGDIRGWDTEAWEALLAEYNVECDESDMSEYDKARFGTYAKKYGIEHTPKDEEYEEGEYVETLLELNESYCEEDILSNVMLEYRAVQRADSF